MVNNSEYMKYLGRRILNARLHAGFTQEHVAEKVGVSRAAITRWEKGEIEPNLEHLTSLVRVLDVSADHLLGIDAEKQKWELDLSEDAVAALKKFVKEVRKQNRINLSEE